MSVEVKRNHGKPTAAQRARAKLDAQKAAKTGVAVPAKPVKAAKKAKSQPVAAAAPTAPAAQPQIPSVAPVQAAKLAVVPAETKSAVRPAAEAKAIEAKPIASKPRNMQVRFTGMKPNHVVEAALFAAGKPILVEEICEASGLRPEVVKDALKALVKEYEARDSVLEIGKAGTKWAMQVRSKASEPAAKFAPMEIPLKTLKTLALIAYHQPMKQSELVDMLGSKIYDHVPELIERGLIRAREEGVTKILTTTALFPEYFGIDAESPEQIRMALAALVGMDPEKARTKAQDAAKAAMEAAKAAADAVPEESATSETPDATPATDAEPGHEAELKH